VVAFFCGKPVSTPDQVRGKLFPENAPMPPPISGLPEFRIFTAASLVSAASLGYRLGVAAILKAAC
jgi:hypothetical protein